MTDPADRAAFFAFVASRQMDERRRDIATIDAVLALEALRRGEVPGLATLEALDPDCAPLPVARTHGSRIVLEDGRELVDGLASWWTACHGYNHPHIAEVVRGQIEAMPHIMFGGFAHEPALRLAKRLSDLLPEGLDRVFFTDSGSHTSPPP